MNRLDMDGRSAVVTGGAAGIGLAIAQRLRASGARLSLWDRDAAALAHAAAQLGGGTHTAHVDVTDEACMFSPGQRGRVWLPKRRPDRPVQFGSGWGDRARI